MKMLLSKKMGYGKKRDYQQAVEMRPLMTLFTTFFKFFNIMLDIHRLVDFNKREYGKGII